MIFQIFDKTMKHRRILVPFQTPFPDLFGTFCFKSQFSAERCSGFCDLKNYIGFGLSSLGGFVNISLRVFSVLCALDHIMTLESSLELNIPVSAGLFVEYCLETDRKSITDVLIFFLFLTKTSSLQDFLFCTFELYWLEMWYVGPMIMVFLFKLERAKHLA